MNGLLFRTLLPCLMLCFMLTIPTSHAQTTPVPSYDFDYQPVAIDAQTYGQVTSLTRQIELGVMIENHSQNTPNGNMTFSFQEGNLRSGTTGNLIQAIETNNTYSLYLPNITERKFVMASNSRTNITKPLPRDIIVASIVVTATFTPANGSAKVVVSKYTENIVYSFSNTEIIPMIFDGLNRR